MNIEGKRSGEGFVAHKPMLINALSRTTAERVAVTDGVTIGTRGFLSYLKALAGSNIVKVVPASVTASDTRGNEKRLKVSCGNNVGYLNDRAWIGDKTPLTVCELRITHREAVAPNIGASELAEAFERVMPFAAGNKEARPTLQCVLLRIGDGKLAVVAADGFRVAEARIDFAGEAAEVLVQRGELHGIPTALRRAKRARLSIEAGKDKEPASLVIDTELLRYRWRGTTGNYPNYSQLIPTDFKAAATFESGEALKAAAALKVLAAASKSAVDITIGKGTLRLVNPDDKGETSIAAEVSGDEMTIRLDAAYFAQALKASGGIVELTATAPNSPILFVANDFQVVVMPMIVKATPIPSAEVAPEAKAEAAAAVTEAVAITEATPEAAPEAAPPAAEAPHGRSRRAAAKVA